MIAVIKGDIIDSRKLSTPEKWLLPLKELLSSWGKAPQQWELAWGDAFQLEMASPEEALKAAFMIKALIKSISPSKSNKKSSPVDVRMAIGIGAKSYSGNRVSENNGEAYILSGEKFEKLKKEKITLALQTPWEDFNEDFNLYLKLAGLFMDNWSVSSGELIKILLQDPEATQNEIGKLLHIKQNSVSGRWSRSHAEELLEIDRIYRKKLKKLLR